ncbi:MAG TPA: DUF4058 family protein [Gemmataceae bacterium]|nr:DUF4058 family protein [Gemmataceae bacterium]
MPLHEWTDRPGWDGLHHLWITELLRWVKPRLPAGYRAYIGTAPTVAIGAPLERPDVHVRQWTEEQTPPAVLSPQPGGANPAAEEPDEEIAVAAIDPSTALYVETQGRLVSAVELVSPRNKDRLVARTTYLSRYVGYLLEGVHLLLVDVHRRPIDFSFADGIAEELHVKQPALPPPMAVSYRVGGPAATGGRILGIWRRPLTVGGPLPVLTLPLTVEQGVAVDLEQTYARAAADAYLA